MGQSLHLACGSALVALAWAAWIRAGQPFAVAYWCAVAFPVAHQVFVWLAWRLELRSSLTSRAIGFRGYLVGFFLLFGGRFISLGVPGIYAAYSVQTYFGMIRAAGADHFDARYRQMPLVWEGIFRFTQNGMYVYAFLLFWAIAMGFNE